MDLSINELKSWYEKNRETVLQDFFTFLKFESISTDPAYKKAIVDCASWIKEYLDKSAFVAELIETKSGHPVVFAHRLVDKSRPTLLIYHHYDVQPVVPLNLWDSSPFDPQVRDGKIYARGAQDNKGQCFYTLTLLKAVHSLGKKLDINIKLFIEGEEECGSKGSSALLSEPAIKEKLKADYLLVVDGGLNEEGVPAINLGARGIVCLNVTCKNSNRDLHSGFAGGLVLNPAKALVQALSLCWDQEGRVAIPGFYDTIVPLSKEELAQLDFPFDEKSFVNESGTRVLQAEKGFSLAQSATLRPTLEINGITSGYGGEGTKTILPATAHVKLSARLVRGQKPDEMARLIEQFLRKNLDPKFEIAVEVHHGGSPFLTSPGSPIAKICSKAFEEVLGGTCQKILCGGSIPITPLLERASGAEALVIGYGLESDAIHAPNEHFSLKRFEQGFCTIGRIISLISSQK